MKSEEFELHYFILHFFFMGVQAINIKVMKFIDKIRQFIHDNSLMVPMWFPCGSDSLSTGEGGGRGRIYLVALSGGADSVCLLLAMKQLGYNVEAIHCNFHLRGSESDRDEDFCKRLCERENVPFHTVHFDTKTYSELHKVSIEMAARELRYNYFEQLRKAIDAEAILVAHHKNDAVETLLMNLIRGTGIHGLQGIKPRNGRIIRPLLGVSRKEIVEWLDSIGQDYVTDSTNLEDDVTRNKLRLNIIPLLEQINPAASDNIAQTALRMVEAGKVFDSAMDDAVANVTAESTDDYIRINKELLNTVASKEYTLHTILSPYHFSPSQIEEISQSDFSQSGKLWESSTHQLVVDRQALLLRKKQENARRSFRIPEAGTYVVSETKDHTEKISIKSVEVDENFKISKERDTVTLDAEKVKFPLTIRGIEQGDRFVPFGMNGSKLVSDYLTDRKKNVFEKQSQLVLVDASDNVLWLIGERPDARCCITDSTIKALVIRYNK